MFYLQPLFAKSLTSEEAIHAPSPNSNGREMGTIETHPVIHNTSKTDWAVKVPTLLHQKVKSYEGRELSGRSLS